MHYNDISYSLDHGIARITLNKPEKMNALSWGSWAELENAIAAADADDSVKVVLLTGAGRGFCAGTDLTTGTRESDWPDRPLGGRPGMMRSRYLGTANLYHCGKPTIAAVNGASVGAGFSLAMACDIRIASEAARFSAIFVKRAIVADTGCTWFLPRLVGVENALKLMYTGRIIDATEALRIGLVSEVVPAEELASRATALAREIADGPSLAIELMKRLTHEGLTRGLDEQIEMEQFLQGITQSSEDAREGRLSFLEKREPVFKGR
ncbi:enoyl-CoA hydratase-related protein [Candidatus Amarobacter glycogenicus]|uniref:enoyl-CoA hydratase/isomerase family protein n=1 Tax=Candidatus Amarobacter glycogenicus TaxID=3140699 RepID=UPI002A11B13E|nr:enoyl-CoA hydratase/isomerase family protein [Dehalococcoidia bacterium]